MLQPAQLGALKRRPFAFYPPILNVEYNEWRLRNMTRTEILVTNLKSDVEVWIPKRLIGEITGAGEDLMTVSLLRRLEYKAGSLRPEEGRVVEMPQPTSEQLSEIPGWEPTGAKERQREHAAALVVALLACLLFAVLYRLAPGQRGDPAADLAALTARDDYAAVVQKLGAAASERERPPYRALWYPQRSCFVILRDGHYIGAFDSGWRVIRQVPVPGGGDSAPELGSLPRF